jgi:hypothetical protein
VETRWLDGVGWVPYDPRKADLRRLVHDAQAVLELREHAPSPTDAAEELLEEVSEWLLRKDVLRGDMVLSSPDEGAPALSRRDGTPASDEESTLFRRMWQDAASNAKCVGDLEMHAEPSAPPRKSDGPVNLRLVFHDSLRRGTLP